VNVNKIQDTMPWEAQQRLADIINKYLLLISQETLAKQLGVSQATISGWKIPKKSEVEGKAWPKVENLRAVARLEHWPLGKLLDYLETGRIDDNVTWDEEIGHLSLRLKSDPPSIGLVAKMLSMISDAFEGRVKEE